MQPGKTDSNVRSIGRSPREEEPELWKTFQKRGTIELLTLLQSDEELRMRDVLEAIPSISKQTLVSRLNELDSLEIVHRRVNDGPPVSTWYSLTALGTEVAEAAEILVRVGSKSSKKR